MDENINAAYVKIIAGGNLKVVGEDSKTVGFVRPGEEMVYFRVKAASLTGIGTVKVQATSGTESASANVELNVRNPNPVMTHIENQVLEAGKSKTFNVQFTGMAGTNKGAITLSGLPSFNLEKRMEELISYPYGCLEQTVSSAFPQLFLGDIMPLSEAQKSNIDKNIRYALNKISGYRQVDGLFTYWPGGNYYSDWSNVYAGHFILLAEQKGYVVSSDLKNSFIKKQNKIASDFIPVKEEWFDNSLIQAYRLYMLALSGNVNLSAMNRLKEQPNLTLQVKWRLAAAYLLAGKPEAATDLVSKLDPVDITEYDKPGETFGSQLRDQAMILETLILMNEKEKAFELVKNMSSRMNSEYLSTQTSAYCIYAFSRFATFSGADREMVFSHNLSGKMESFRSQYPVFSIQIPEGSSTGSTVTIENQGKGTLFVTVTTTGQPLNGIEITENRNLNLSVKYFSQEGKEITIENLSQGTDFIAEVTISNPGILGSFTNVALNQIFPSGWEILNTRISDVPDASIAESSYDYRDIRDDRVNTFFSLPAAKSARYRVNLNAAYTGKFYMPAINCAPMYESSAYARQKGQWVTVTK